MKRIIAALALIIISVCLFCGCNQSERVSYNISKSANNFNVTRRIAVINARTDKPIFELIGRFSIENTATNELAIICETDEGVYKKHYIYLNEWTIYVVEDVSGAYVDSYHYEVNFLPEMINPVTIVSED